MLWVRIVCRLVTRFGRGWIVCANCCYYSYWYYCLNSCCYYLDCLNCYYGYYDYTYFVVAAILWSGIAAYGSDH